MKIIVADNYIHLSEIAAGMIAKEVIENPNAVLGLATGTSPLGTYKKLIDFYENGLVSFSKVHTVNLDEYVGLNGEHRQSYRYFMNTNLFDYIDIDKNNTFVPCGIGDSLEENCSNYDNILQRFPRDIQLLGIGGNGHIGFNEPGTPFGSKTHIVDLTERTRKDNARLFAEGEKVPEEAITMGIKEICKAKKIILIASGQGKADAIYKTVCGEVSEACPASILQLHNDVTLILDKEAASKLDESVISQAI